MSNAKLNSKVLGQRLSQRLANFELKDEVITRLADRYLLEGLDMIWWDICVYGICIDYYCERTPRLDQILSKTDVARIDVFPYGIIDWDRFRVHVEYYVDELQGRVPGGPMTR